MEDGCLRQTLFVLGAIEGVPDDASTGTVLGLAGFAVDDQRTNGDIEADLAVRFDDPDGAGIKSTWRIFQFRD